MSIFLSLYRMLIIFYSSFSTEQEEDVALKLYFGNMILNQSLKLPDSFKALPNFLINSVHAFGYSPCHIWLGCKITGVCATCACLYPWHSHSPGNGLAQSVFSGDTMNGQVVKERDNHSASFPAFLATLPSLPPICIVS